MSTIQGRKAFPLHRRLLTGGLATIVATLLLLVAGSLRYGGPDGLLLRVQAEFVTQRPHPQLVPTPMATPTGGIALALALPSETPEQPTATPTLAPEPATATPTATRVAGQQREPAAAAPLVVPSDAPREPTATPSPTPLPAPTPTPLDGSLPGSAELSGFSHFWQTWNNCGPATLAMNLSFFGSELSQAQVAKALKPDKHDKNVAPEEMAAFARSQGYTAWVRVNGDFDRLRRLLSSGFPVLVETWLDHDGGMGHYRLLTGYDDGRREWIVYDSYVSQGVDPDEPYSGIRIPYDELAGLWRVFNRTYIVILTDNMASAMFNILGEDRDDTAMWQRSLLQAQSEVQRRPEDAFAWFNLGSSYVALGQHEQAAAAYDQARVIGLPWRMLWYQFGPFVAYHETGRFQELAALADATIATAGNVEETFYWRGKGLQALGDRDGARQAYERAVALNANYAEARQALAELSG